MKGAAFPATETDSITTTPHGVDYIHIYWRISGARIVTVFDGVIFYSMEDPCLNTGRRCRNNAKFFLIHQQWPLTVGVRRLGSASKDKM